MSKLRIYTYKITFEEVPYYYYGVHKERYYNENYLGSPITNKWCWEFYTPKKQILEFFDYNEEGWIRAQEVEKTIISKFYKNDKWCLNKSCGGSFSTDILKMGGKMSGETSKNKKTGIFSLPEETIKENRRKGGQSLKEKGLGIFNLNPSQLSENGKRGAEVSNSRIWKCTETGFESIGSTLTKYQKKRNICITKRVRIK